MDHFGYAEINPDYVPLKVPYLCAEIKLYDSKGFFDFPERCGRGKDWPNNELNNLLNKKPLSRPAEEEAAFLQAWLYFGFLSEVLGVPVDPVKDSFVVGAETESAFVSTKCLPKILSDWKRRVSSMPENMLDKTLQHIEQVVPYVGRRLLAAVGFLEGLRDRELCPFPFEVEESIYGLATTVDLTKVHIFGVSRCMNLSGQWASPFAGLGSEHLKSQMLLEGWCPTDITMFSEQLDVATVHYIRSCFTPRLKGRHESCSKLDCVAVTVLNPKTQEAQHVVSDCVCPRLEPDLDAASQFIMSDKVPLIKLERDSSTGNTCRASFVAAKSESFYVAISHVWSDGLGNATGNWIPQCQAVKLLEIANQLKERSHVSKVEESSEKPQLDQKTPDPVYIWLDTLCVPRKPSEIRRLAISKMRKVYLNASAVVVLDQYISSSKAKTCIDSVCTVACSNWTRRMWTFQEGAIANKLYFQFSDKIVWFEDPTEYHAAKQPANVEDFGWRSRFLARYTLIHRWRPAGDDLKRILEINDKKTTSGGEAQTNLIRHTWLTMRWRSTTDLKDEAICFGALLDLDLLEISNTPKAERLKKLFSLIQAFPAEAIFSRCKRLDIDGFRWAPSSFMEKEPDARSGFDEQALLVSSQVGVRYDNKGLAVQYPGFTFESRAQSLPPFFYIRCRKSGIWYQIITDTCIEVKKRLKSRTGLTGRMMSLGQSLNVVKPADLVRPTPFGVVFRDRQDFPSTNPCAIVEMMGYEYLDEGLAIAFGKMCSTGQIRQVHNPTEQSAMRALTPQLDNGSMGPLAYKAKPHDMYDDACWCIG